MSEKSNFQLMRLYDRLGGIGFNSEARHACFKCRKAAMIFKKYAPKWHVVYQVIFLEGK